MKTAIAIATGLTIALGASGAAFAQANPNAPQMNSAGTGVTTPKTDSRGTAVDRHQTTGSSAVAPRGTGAAAGNNANSMGGSNSPAGSNDSVEGRSGGGSGGASGGGR